MNNQSVHKGSCLCGEVNFEVTGTFDAMMLCHCKHCQKGTGSAHGANAFSSQAKLQWLSGADLLRKYTLKDTRHTKCFCSQCGSALPYMFNEHMLVLPAGSLDTEFDFKPTAHIFCRSKAVWEQHLTETIQFEKLPQSDE